MGQEGSPISVSHRKTQTRRPGNPDITNATDNMNGSSPSPRKVNGVQSPSKTNGNDATVAANVLSGLQSDKSAHRLKQISSVRARGTDIDLPQLVVCGDQSAGKSSVLEGITSIPFPRSDGLCTKFPTEVILEHSEQNSAITASIIPNHTRDTRMKQKLEGFHASLKNYAELPRVITKVGELMGIKGYGSNQDGPGFAEDVLRINVVGRTGLHLSIVDLPGLVSVASDEQTEGDLQTVDRMVDAYIGKPRTIILAIVQASNDIANQRIIKKSKFCDTAGARTVGIITKPDLINKGTEVRIAALAKNLDTTRLKLGFFLLKNPTPEEMAQSITSVQRSAKERYFFDSELWRAQNLDRDRVGIDKLREFLQRLLDQHIEQELPKVREEIRNKLDTTERDLNSLPVERPGVPQLRMYLSSLAMQFHSLTVAALNGDYHTCSFADFFEAGGDQVTATRLRALVHQTNTDFATCMREKGKTMTKSPAKITQLTPGDTRPFVGFGTNPSNASSCQTGFGAYASNASAFQTGVVTVSDVGKNLQQMPSSRGTSEDAMKEWVKHTYLKTRGRELPGNSSASLLTELFHFQSRRWPEIAKAHLDSIAHHVEVFVKGALKFINMEDYVREELAESIKVRLAQGKAKAEDELKQLCLDEQSHPITYNHYYTDNVQKPRMDNFRKLIDSAIDRMGQDNVVSNMPLASIKSALSKSLIVNMDDQACSEALLELDSYYKVCRTDHPSPRERCTDLSRSP